jgi:thioredoxin reductase (NADPH)
MITKEELAKVPLFSQLGDRELQYIADTVPDIHVIPGEYLIHEGDDRSLLVTIEGKLEITKIMDGVERAIGVRLPGQLFGEIPMMLSTPFPAAMRAVEPSRVIRIDPHEFHTLSAMAPAISAQVGADAMVRLGGLKDLADKPHASDVMVIGPRWDPAVHDLRSFLNGNHIHSDWKPEDEKSKDAAYPVLVLPDGKRLVAPTHRDVAMALGLQVMPKQREYDVLIVGGGPAGLTSAVYGASEGLSTILIESVVPGGQAGTSSRIENYLGFPFGISGDELARRALDQAKRLGAEVVVTRTVEAIDTATRTVTLDGGETLHARAIILSMGVTWRRLKHETLEKLHGKGVYYGASRGEATSIQGKNVFLIGGGNSAGQAALFFANHANSVTLLVRAETLSSSMSHYLIEQLKTKDNVRVATRSEVAAAHGTEHLEALDITDHATGKTDRHEAAALFVMIGADAKTGWLPDKIARDVYGYIVTGAEAAKMRDWNCKRDPHLLETSVPGVFAVGDVRAGSVKRIATSVGEGSMAIAFTHKYLAAPDPF